MGDSVPEIVDQVLSEETDTKNLVLSVFQNAIISGVSPENVENEIIPCAYSTVEDLLEKASNIDKYVKKTYPQMKVFWVTPGPVGYFSEEDKRKWEEKMELDSKEQEVKKKGEPVVKSENKDKDEEKDEDEDKDEDKEDKEDEDKADEDKSEDEDEDEDKDEDEEKVEKDENDKKEETNEIKIEEEEKEEDPELRKLRRACSSC